MPAWNESTPYRTGIPTVLKMLTVICGLLVTFNVIIKGHLRDDLHVYVDGLMEACELFRSNVPNPRDS